MPGPFESAAVPGADFGEPKLARRLGLPLLVLYGVGITVGAGIYVLIGAVAGHAGRSAAWSFVLAALVMGFTVASYAELATRYPVSAGEAAYVRNAFGSRLLSRLTGITSIAIGIVSCAAVALGSAGYIREFVDWPVWAIVIAVVGGLGTVAAWGILESVLLASFFTLVEVGGLLAIIVAAAGSGIEIAMPLPAFEPAALAGVAFASLLAFFAFIGFEDLANAVEEAREPRRTIPAAMGLTLAVSTLLYVTVAAVATSAVDPAVLGASAAPLSLVFAAVSGASPAAISAIAIVATLNTVLAQMTMAARVIYGMARQGDLPQAAGRVNPRTHTPLAATAFIVVAVVVLALAVSFEGLAESTSLATLGVFAAVNLALLAIRLRKLASPNPHVTVPLVMPIAGFLTCLAMIAASLLG